MSDLANLEIRVDSTDANQAAKALDNMANAGGRAETQTQKFTTATRFATHEVQNLMYQLNDVVVGFASGQAPMTIFMQQGAQITQILGSRPGGIAAGFKALQGLIPASVVAFGAVTIAVAVAAKSFIDYQNSVDRLGAAGAGIGRMAGITTSEMLALADASAQSGDVTAKAARDMAVSFALTGQIGGQVFADLIAVQRDYAVATGQKSKDATKALGEAFSDPIKGAQELNAELGFLNATQMAHIQTLVEEGNRTQAQKYLADQLSKSVHGMAEEYGGLGNVLHNVGNAAGYAWDQMGKFLSKAKEVRAFDWRTVTEEDVKKANANPFGAKGLKVGDMTFDLGFFDDPKVKAEKARKEAQEKARIEAARRNSASAAAARITDQYMPDKLGDLKGQQAQLAAGMTAQRAGGEAAALARTSEAYNAVTRAINTYLPPAEKAHQLAVVEAQLAATKNPAERGRLAAKKAEIQAAGEVVSSTVVATRATDAQTLATNRASGSSNTRADSLRRQADAMDANARGALALADAYLQSDAAALRADAQRRATTDATRRGADVEAQVARQLALMTAEQAANSAKTFVDMKARNDVQAKTNDLVRSGVMTSAQANEYMSQEMAMRPVLAAADVATGATKAKLLEIVKMLNTEYDRANQIQADSRLADALVAQREELANLDLELKLVNATNRERAVAIAQLQAMRDLKKMGITDTNSPEAKQYVGDAVATANKQQDLSSGVGDAIKEGERYMAMLDRMVARSNDAGADMAGAFGDLGAALGDLTSVLGVYATQQERIELERKKALQEANGDTEQMKAIEIDYAKQSAHVQIKSYGDIAGAAKGFFKEKSVGYEVMQKAEQAFRIFEFAMSAKSVVVKTVETAAKVGLFGAQASAAAAAGAANMFATLGPLGFAAVAAMAAVLVGFGIKSTGGGGAAPGAMDMENRQKSQGTGSVLGDASAQSESIARAIEIVASNSNQDLEYSNAMLRSLQSIDNQIGAVAAALAQSFGAGGALDKSKLNLGTEITGPGTLMKILNPLSVLLPGLFGTKTNKTLQDQGIDFGSGSLGDILTGGLSGKAYQQVLTETTKKFLGVTYSNKTSSNTTTEDLSADFLAQVTSLIASMKDGVLQAAGVLGLTGAEATLNSFSVELGKLSFKDMTGDEIEAALNGIFSKLGDDMATAVLPMLKEFQKVGEGTFETLARVARGYQVVDVAMRSIGKTFPLVGLSSIAARESLIDLVGGMDALVDKTGYFRENFLSEQEQMIPVITSVAVEMNRLGYSSVRTRDQFKNLVLGLDLSTEAGRSAYAALLEVAPAFDKVTEYMDAINGIAPQKSSLDLIKDATSALQDAYKASADGFQDTIDKFKSFATALKKFREGLDTGPAAMLSPEEQYRAAKAAFEQASSGVDQNDPNSIANFQTVAQAFIEASKDYNATGAAYFADLSAVKAATDRAANASEGMANAAAAELAALNELVKGWIKVDESVLSVKDAITNLAAVILAANAAVAAAISAAATPATTPANDNTTNWASYLQNNPDVMAWAQSGHGDPDKPIDQQTMEERAAYHWSNSGRSEGRKPYAKGGMFTNGIVSQPTEFDASIMGEGGRPEAIMPLVRGPSGLGVRAVSAGSDNSDVVEALRGVQEVLEAIVRQQGAASVETIGKLQDVVEKLDKNNRTIKQVAA